MLKLKPNKPTQANLVSSDQNITLAELRPDLHLMSVEYEDYGLRTYGVSEVLAMSDTVYQRVLIAESLGHGRILMLDGKLQSAESDEELYHELLVHPSMTFHPNPRRVLIIGGGEGATLREVLKHKTVETVTMVDIDAELIELSKRYLGSWHRGSFEDPRLKLQITDGREFIEGDQNKYDIVIMDVVDLDLNGPSRSLYTVEFFQLLKARLAAGGLVAIQSMSISHMNSKGHGLLRRTLESVFSEVHSYHTSIPSFHCDWTFIIVSDWLNPNKQSRNSFDDVLATRLKGSSLKHLDGEYFLSCLSFSKIMREEFRGETNVLRD